MRMKRPLHHFGDLMSRRVEHILVCSDLFAGSDIV